MEPPNGQVASVFCDYYYYNSHIQSSIFQEMKAIIPVAGIGIKLRPHTHTQPKALLPVAGKPILAHIVDGLIVGGFKEFVFITGYLGSKVESFIFSRYPSDLYKMNFVIQAPREGTAHAIWSARDFIKDEKEVLIMLGDTILDLKLSKFLKGRNSALGVMKVEKPTMFGVAELDSKNFIQKLVEKPTIPKSNLSLVGIYKVLNPPLLVEAADHLVEQNIKTHNEFQLTDALMYMIKKGEKMKTFTVDNWYDCGRKASVLQANVKLFNQPKFRRRPKGDYPQTILIPPISIGANCKIENSIIGPNVSLGDNTIVRYSIVKNTIAGSFSQLKHVVLENSIIGNDTSLEGLNQSLNIGDNTEIHFST